MYRRRTPRNLQVFNLILLCIFEDPPSGSTDEESEGGPITECV